MTIDALPTLDRTSPTFRSEVDTYLGTQLPAFTVQAEAARLAIVASEAATTASAAAALASQLAAAASAASTAATAGVVLWVSGSTYAAGVCVYSPINGVTYRRTSSSPGSSTTDPSADSARWGLPVIAKLPTTHVTGTSQAATAGNMYLLENVAATTVTLPSSPSADDQVAIKVCNGLVTNVVNPNGATIEGVSGNMTLDSVYASILLQYINSSWRLI